jgi:hypothetical protein
VKPHEFAAMFRSPDAGWRPISELRALVRSAGVCYATWETRQRRYLLLADLNFESARLREALRLPQLKQPDAVFRISTSEDFPLQIRWKTGGLNFPDWVIQADPGHPYRLKAERCYRSFRR